MKMVERRPRCELRMKLFLYLACSVAIGLVAGKVTAGITNENSTVRLRMPAPEAPPPDQMYGFWQEGEDEEVPQSSILSLTTLLIFTLPGMMMIVITYILYFMSDHVASALSEQWKYWRVLAFYVQGGDYDTPPFYKDDFHAKTHLQSFALMIHLWGLPHYRSGTFQNDMVKNLRNVAFPGTGLPLSALCSSKPLLIAFLFVGYPFLCLGYAMACAKKKSLYDITHLFKENLIHPSEWFFFWRTNCVVASLHAFITNTNGYGLEDKLAFLLEGEAKGIAVSPFFKSSGIICKDRNEEGGMGIHVYRNATQDGQWILQELLTNADTIRSWLPERAPLSTLRVITSSTHALHIIDDKDDSGDELLSKVNALSCVWRAGRENAETDHSSILFDVDLATGKIGDGTTNAHWYQLGPHGNLFKYTPSPSFSSHPDSLQHISGGTIPNIKEIKELVCKAHAKMLPDVPLCGWDVALTKEYGMCLLEVNISCNFFNGSFNKENYFSYVNKFYSELDPHLKALHS
eukprot:m.83507 g.83507  ORF g.83507 m.83507 type:complete len:517 (+) comp8691_c2_seq1:230-1780(+)